MNQVKTKIGQNMQQIKTLSFVQNWDKNSLSRCDVKSRKFRFTVNTELSIYILSDKNSVTQVCLLLHQMDKNSIFWFWNGKLQFKFFRDFWWIEILSKLKRTCLVICELSICQNPNFIKQIKTCKILNLS